MLHKTTALLKRYYKELGIAFILKVIVMIVIYNLFFNHATKVKVDPQKAFNHIIKTGDK